MPQKSLNAAAVRGSGWAVTSKMVPSMYRTMTRFILPFCAGAILAACAQTPEITRAAQGSDDLLPTITIVEPAEREAVLAEGHVNALASETSDPWTPQVDEDGTHWMVGEAYGPVHGVTP